MTKLVHWITSVIREPDAEPEVHFHSGPYASPTACYDAHCGAPRLDLAVR